MLNIAICDDDIQITGKIERLLQDIAKRNFVDTEIEVFWNGKSLADAIAAGERYDVIYLDIEMDKEDGISAARRIRTYDKNVRIIYVTSHESYMRESFEVRPFQFLVKPVTDKIMEKCFKSVYEDINSEDFYFRYSYQRMNHKVPIKDILYFESNKRKIFIVTEQEILGMNILIFYVYMKLADDLRLRRMAAVYEQQLELCERHQQERELSMLQLRDIKHNMKNNLISILAYAENKEYEKMTGFIEEIMGEGGMVIASISNSGNIVIDSLIGYWYVTAQNKRIIFKTDICIPMIMPFKGADLSLILGNLLENAVEAAEKVEENRYINVKMKFDKNNLLLFVDNSYKGKLLKTRDNRLKSTKSDAENHGVGLASVYRAVAKYHGSVVIEDSEPGKFKIRIVLYSNVQE